MRAFEKKLGRCIHEFNVAFSSDSTDELANLIVNGNTGCKSWMDAVFEKSMTKIKKRSWMMGKNKGKSPKFDAGTISRKGLLNLM